MEHSSESSTPIESSVSRQELLKVLAASGGGLIAAAFLPKQWLKPVIEAGVLPAHAQQTLSLRITEFEVHQVVDRILSERAAAPCDIGNFKGSLVLIDTWGQLNHPSAPIFHPSTSLGAGDFSASATDGNRWTTPYTFSIQACCGTAFSLYTDMNGRNSNLVNDILGCVPG